MGRFGIAPKNRHHDWTVRVTAETATAAKCKSACSEAQQPTQFPSLRPLNLNPTHHMLRWTLIFLVIAVIAGLLGFTGVAGTASEIAKILFFVFLVLLIISALISAFKGRPPV